MGVIETLLLTTALAGVCGTGLGGLIGAMCVDAYGELLTDGNSTSPFSAGFHYRPAMWINIAE